MVDDLDGDLARSRAIKGLAGRRIERRPRGLVDLGPERSLARAKNPSPAFILTGCYRASC